MQAGSGLKKKSAGCHFIKSMTYFCNLFKRFIHIFQINCF